MPQTLKSVPVELTSRRPRAGIPDVPLRVVPDDPLALLGDQIDFGADDAQALVKSLAVSRMLAGAGSDVVRRVVEIEAFGESEPLLLAGAALAYSWLDIAESAIARATSELAQTARPEVAAVVSLALLNMAMSRQRGDAAAGLAHARQLQEIMGGLTMSERARAPELSPLIDYYVAGFELCLGNVNAARWTLERGTGRFRQWADYGGLDVAASSIEQRVRADCAGQLSWIDAFCGDLRRATWYATALISDRPAASAETGLAFAHLAMAWTHLERGEMDQATEGVDHALSTSSDTADPLLAAAERLTRARLATVSGEPESALRLLHPVQTTSEWFADQVRVATAEAWLAAGEPQQVIDTLSPEPQLAFADARLLSARALRLTGGLQAAEQMLARVPSDPIEISLISQVKRFLLQAELALEDGNRERAVLMVDRALRVAAKEELRSTVASAGAWLRTFVAAEPQLLRRYSAFLAALPELAILAAQPGSSAARSDDATYVVPLTAREIDVLRGLADYCSNEEIAADLVLSLNTVKTHMRSLFQKLSVTRRADAVRRGRSLGLC
jgi:LuxR family transcriptional regulator, maltose regulon positive regulatory protein